MANSILTREEVESSRALPLNDVVGALKAYSSTIGSMGRMNARHWWITRDGDPKCLEMYKRHYSRYQYKDGREPNLFVGPGEKLVLRTRDGDAFFVWRKFIDDSGEKGVNCAAFRNESDIKSSELIRQACEIARVVWPDSRMYTFVNPGKVRSKNPGYCFLMAGWRRCQHRTKSGLIVFDTW